MSCEKSSLRSGPYKTLFAQGVRVGDVLYLSGQVGVDAQGVAGATLVEQVVLAYANIRRVLAHFDATLSQVVDETLFVTDIAALLAQAEEVYAVREQAYGQPPEVCQTVVQVSALLLPALQIEIKCIAHL